MSLELLLVAVVLVAVTVVIHGLGINYWLRFVVHRYTGEQGHFEVHKTMPALMWSAVFLMLLHLVEVILWALTYLLFVPGDTLDSWEKSIYFSFVTFTTLGYGDITLPAHDWRVLSGIEALNGILLVGWSTAFLFAILQQSWKSIAFARDVR